MKIGDLYQWGEYEVTILSEPYDPGIVVCAITGQYDERDEDRIRHCDVCDLEPVPIKKKSLQVGDLRIQGKDCFILISIEMPSAKQEWVKLDDFLLDNTAVYDYISQDYFTLRKLVDRGKKFEELKQQRLI